MISKIAKNQANGQAIVKTVSSPQLMSMPSRQSQYHNTAFTNGVIVQPMMPAIKAKISKIAQKSMQVHHPSITAAAAPLMVLAE